jgi:AraC family transcriptional regulator, positive regulator of tynA and feaB
MTAKGTSGIQKWSTSVATPGKRLDYWIGAVCEGFLEMDITSSRASHFEASLERGQLGSIGVNRVLGTSQDVYRTRSAISRSQSNYYYLLCKTDSEFSVVHHDNVSRILPGDLTLVDSRRRYEFHFPVSANTISLELPTSWVETWVREPDKHIGSALTGTPAGDGRSAAFPVKCHPRSRSSARSHHKFSSTSWGRCLPCRWGRKIATLIPVDIATRYASEFTTLSGSVIASRA